MWDGLIGIRRWDSFSGTVFIRNSYNIGSICGKNSAGGLIGEMGNYTNTKVNICNSYSLGDIECVNDAGGLLCYIRANNGIDAERGSFTNVCNFSSMKAKEIGGIAWKVKDGEVTQKYTYYPNTIDKSIYSGGSNDGSTALDLEYMKSQEFMDVLNENIENLDETGLAKWIIGEDGNPTLDFNTIWDGEKWVTNN